MKFAWFCSHESYQPEALVEKAVLAEGVRFDIRLIGESVLPRLQAMGENRPPAAE